MVEHLGKPTYYLLRFIIKSCCQDIAKVVQYDDIIIYKITHPFYVENQFNKKITDGAKTYLYHGSNSANWYSILRNGIKVLSNTTMQKNGAAYGKGIYMSDQFNTSFGYCGALTDKPFIMGVYEVIGTKTDYGNSPIFVIPSHDLCLLRYLIVGKYKINTSGSRQTQAFGFIFDGFKMVEKYFSSKICEESEQKSKILIINNKKLMKEYSKLTKSTYNIVLVNSNILDWEVTWSGVTICLKFPQLFPVEPPFVFIKTPKFNPSAYNITGEGAICCEYLTKSQWIPALSVESLIVQIFALIIEPNFANIQDINFTYDHSMAIQSYEQLAKGNGWL
jgi:ubiquitin-protein ligase